jgi:hypothetical protein
MAHGKIAGIFKAPLHFLGSVPVAAVSLVAPPVGDLYIKWRREAEEDDVKGGRDTPEKAKIDFISQTVLVKSVLRIWGIKPQ